jgi:fatty acid desaturase
MNAYIQILAVCLLALCVGVFLLWMVVKVMDWVVWLKTPSDIKEHLRNEQIAQRQATKRTRAERLREERTRLQERKVT